MIEAEELADAMWRAHCELAGGRCAGVIHNNEPPFRGRDDPKLLDFAHRVLDHYTPDQQM